MNKIAPLIKQIQNPPDSITESTFTKDSASPTLENVEQQSEQNTILENIDCKTTKDDDCLTKHEGTSYEQTQTKVSKKNTQIISGYRTRSAKAKKKATIDPPSPTKKIPNNKQTKLKKNPPSPK